MLSLLMKYNAELAKAAKAKSDTAASSAPEPDHELKQALHAQREALLEAIDDVADETHEEYRELTHELELLDERLAELEQRFPIGFITDQSWDEIQRSLQTDLSYLRTLAGSQEKDPFKRELIEKYRPVVDSLLSSHDNLANLDVIWWFYLWQIDLGQFERVADPLLNAIRLGLTTPSNWKSNAITAYLDLVYTYSTPTNPEQQWDSRFLIAAVNALLGGSVATNAVLKLKLYKTLGHYYYHHGEKEKAHELYQQVMTLDPKKGGVKTRLTELKEELGYE